MNHTTDEERIAREMYKVVAEEARKHFGLRKPYGSFDNHHPSLKENYYALARWHLDELEDAKR
jgi:hypothetical protein